ncbi:MAG: ABC transporter substrate-binding protein [Prosthecobacter sp.]|jgi:phospholipid transport system substrate-binding protein|uniref:Tgt2/MlaC family protein n=1 Tax=Prosthecobacter sp. TaxID=1965333 RepID=UPI0019D9DCFE|nr:ABC transporter substrate-binding protein [Prosthecobacter sp.]MBE2286551.1 ABC transporter substrate-binding protein [Prosthecobacter sp.]
MTSRSFLAALFTVPWIAIPASAQPVDAQLRLKSAVNEVLAVADRAPSRSALPERVRPVLMKHVSFETMTRRAVGVGWRSMTEDQQRRATQLFATLIIRSYSSKFTPGEHPAITYLNAVSPAAGRVDVPTKMVYKGSHYSVTYRMEQESGWKIADVVIEGVSLIANYRSQLDAQFKKGGAESVLSSLTQSVSRPQ